MSKVNRHFGTSLLLTSEAEPKLLAELFICIRRVFAYALGDSQVDSPNISTFTSGEA